MVLLEWFNVHYLGSEGFVYSVPLSLGIHSEAAQWLPGTELYWILYILCFSYSYITVIEFINWAQGRIVLRWRGGWECLLLVQRTWVRVQASTWQFTSVSKFSSRDPASILFWSLGALCACGRYIDRHIYRQTLIHIK